MSATKHELDSFIATWEMESKHTLRMLESLPAAKYDYRPDMTGRSLGELAWHLSEIEAYMTYGIETGSFDLGMKPPGIERPREVGALAPGYRSTHADAVARVNKLKPSDLDRKLKFFNGEMKRVGDILWEALLHHHIHHRGQLGLMNRLAGGKTPGIYGPSREEIAALRAAAQAKG
jgi:uncharacterized damage-inducible protein DinB